MGPRGHQAQCWLDIEDVASPSLSDSTTVPLHPSSPTRATGRTASAGPVQPAYGGWTAATATSAATSPNSGAATRSARSADGASACSLPWWVGQEGLGGWARLGPAHPYPLIGSGGQAW